MGEPLPVEVTHLPSGEAMVVVGGLDISTLVSAVTITMRAGETPVVQLELLAPNLMAAVDAEVAVVEDKLDHIVGTTREVDI